ncbi:hypothetical protein MPSEU_000054200 [Mayamaea pseudoterrestris]|nr:hypothetical protein MPSEU_000054200 [Mayamaea pseudoterrestris]
MFPVPKGESDIRLVFDATASGLNEVLFAPWFALPTVSQMVRTVAPQYYCADNDFGEMFYNFWLHEELRPYTGIDLTGLCPDERSIRGGRIWEHFTRPTMGLGPSPYQAVQGALQFKGLVLGRGSAEASADSNAFHWVSVELNVPGMLAYDPAQPWISKRRKDGRVAVDMHLFVDDSRTTAPTEELAWQGGSRIAKLASWYGLQDAARKRRPPSQTPGAWSGSVVSTTEEGVFVSVSVERWGKTRAAIAWIKEQLSQDPKAIEFKQLERIRGFLVYVGQTYRSLVPYLKGIHLTLDSWRGNRDEEGWRHGGSKRVEEQQEAAEAPAGEDDASAPARVRVVARLAEDVEALLKLTNHATPPLVSVRPSQSARVVIGFGDASGSGFGISEADNKGDYEVIQYVYGVWEERVSNESSNFRELNNFVVRIESGLSNGTIQPGTEFFLFTDNFVTERAFYKGTSKAKVLFELVLRLRTLEMIGKIFLHVIWCSGKRMIAQGTDGLSRGDLANGVLVGESMLDFVPIHLSPLERSPELERWIRSWCPRNALFLKEADWFDCAHTETRPMFWFPAPALSDVALEQLCEAWHARPHVFHCIVVPSLMTSRWRRQMRKASDVMFTIPIGASFWREEMFESLTLALVCPLLPASPWQVRRMDLARDTERNLSGVWEGAEGERGAQVRKFWLQAKAMAGL